MRNNTRKKNMEQAVSSCRVCGNENVNEDFESLLNSEENDLSKTGQLYEELFGLKIDLNVIEFFPRYLCNSCNLQMRLFKTLKCKALETMEYLKKQIKLISIEKINLSVLNYDNSGDEQLLIEEDDNLHYQLMDLFEDEVIHNSNTIPKEMELTKIDESMKSAKNGNSECLSPNPKGYKLSETHLNKIKSIKKDMDNSEKNVTVKDYEDVIDMLTEEYEENKDIGKIAIDIPTEKNDMKSVSFLCTMCSIEFVNLKDYFFHRKVAHNNEYICETCGKILETAAALKVHTEIHKDDPLFSVVESLQESNHIENEAELTKIYEIKNGNSGFEICEKLHISKGFESSENSIKHLTKVIDNSENNETIKNCENLIDILSEEYEEYEEIENIEINSPSENNENDSELVGTAFRCTICSIEFSQEEDFFIHRRVVHNNKYICTICDKEFQTTEILKDHSQIHNEDSLFRALDLSKEPNRIEIDTKLTKNYYEVKYGNSGFEICETLHNNSKEYEISENKLKSPIKDVSNTENNETLKNYEIDILAEEYEQYEEIENMEIDISIKKNDNKTQSAAGRTFRCTICSIEFPKRKDYFIHKRVVHNNKYVCPVCGKESQTADALKVHSQIHSEDPLFICQKCNKTFNQKAHYKYHMDRHNNIRNFKCEICKKSYLTKSDLNTHMRCHSGNRPFKCDICNRDYLSVQHLKMHRYSHFEKSFECEICNQMFISPATLRTHVNSIHSNVRRFKCAYCDKMFRRKHHLHTHFKTHKPDEKSEIVNNSIHSEDELVKSFY